MSASLLSSKASSFGPDLRDAPEPEEAEENDGDSNASDEDLEAQYVRLLLREIFIIDLLRFRRSGDDQLCEHKQDDTWAHAARFLKIPKEHKYRRRVAAWNVQTSIRSSQYFLF